MARRQYISQQKKLQIADLYKNSNLSIGAIADKLKVSVRTVHNYKNYNGSTKEIYSELKPESFEQELDDRQDLEQEEQDADLEDEQETEIIEDDELSEKKSWPIEEVTECPECGKPKDECWTIDQALEQGYRIPEGYERFYDYVCSNPECRIFFPDYRYKIKGTCPDPNCRSTSRDWAPIEETFVSDEKKRKYDFLCLICNELINIDDL